MQFQRVFLVRFCCLISILFGYRDAFAQTAEMVKEKRYGLPGETRFSKAIQTKDGGYLIGSDWSGDFETFKAGKFRGGESDFSLFKTNKKGKLLWEKSFGSQYKDNLTALCETADGGYLIGGNIGWGLEQRRDSVKNFTDVSGNYKGRRDIWIIKIDAKGNKQWDKLFGGSYREELGTILPLPDGFLLAGSSESEISGDKAEMRRGGFDFWVIRTDLKGAIIWQKTLGGDKQDMAYTAVTTPDGGFLIGGVSNSTLSGDKTQASRSPIKWDTNFKNISPNEPAPDSYNIGVDYWVVKLNAAGEKIWDRRYGGPADDYLRTILKLKDGNFLLGGTSRSGPGGDKLSGQRPQGPFASREENYWVVKITSDGLQLWDKTYGGSRGDELHSMLETLDGNLLLGGYSFSESSGDKTESHRGMTVWLIKTDQNGNKIWDKQFAGPPNSRFYRLDLMQPSKKGYVFIGRSDSRNPGKVARIMKQLKIGSIWLTTPNWLVKVKELNHPVITTGNVLPAICNDQPFEVPFTALGNFKPGNAFSVQLSNAKGKFKRPVTIGMLEGSAAGVHKIMATLPKGMISGKGYLVRVAASQPAVIGKSNAEKFGIGQHAIQVEVSPWMSPKGGVGPYKFSLDNGNFVMQNLPELIKFSNPGKHEVTIRDARNCTVSKTFWKGEAKGLDVPVHVEGVPNLMTWFELPTVDRKRKEYQEVIIDYEFKGKPGRIDIFTDGLQASTKEAKSREGKLRFSYTYHDRNRDCIVVIRDLEPGTKCTYKVTLAN